MTRIKPRNKFNARKVVVDKITFDSMREAKYYSDLKLLARAGDIGDIVCHPEYKLTAHNQPIGKFKPDFRFYDHRQGRHRLVDIKSPPTAKKADFRLRKKLFEAQYGIELEIVF